MNLTFVHTCIPDTAIPGGCPVYDREVIYYQESVGHLNDYVVPDVRCRHTNAKLKLVAVDGNRNI